jgi:hypothetical protein
MKLLFACLLLLAPELLGGTKGLSKAIPEQREGERRVFAISDKDRLVASDIHIKLDMTKNEPRTLVFHLVKTASHQLSKVQFSLTHHGKTISLPFFDMNIDEGNATLAMIGLPEVNGDRALADATMTLTNAEWYLSYEEQKAEDAVQRADIFRRGRDIERDQRQGLTAPKGKQRSEIRDGENLRSNFAFDTVAEVITMVKRVSKKTEFETEDDYNARLRAALKRRVAIKLPLAFGEYEHVSYDPKDRCFRLGLDVSSLMVDGASAVTGSYVGSNAFGATARVTSKQGNTIWIGMTSSYDFVGMEEDGGVTWDYSYSRAFGKIPCPPDEAKANARKFAIVYSGFVTKAYVERHRSGATLDSPTDVTMTYQHVDFDPESLSVYVVNTRTGRIEYEVRFCKKPKH